MNNGYIKQLALKAGFVLGKLNVDPRAPHTYGAVVAIGNDPSNLDVVESKFVPSMEKAILEATGVPTKIVLHNVKHMPHNFVEFNFTFLTDETEDPRASQAVEGQPTTLAALGSVVQSANGYTGQVVAYSRDEPRLIKVRWHKFSTHSKGSTSTFDTWENPVNQKVVYEPVRNQWWPKPGEPINQGERPAGIGVPVQSLMQEEEVELTADDLVLRTLLDKEMEARAPKTVPLGTYPGPQKCACGCGGSCKNYFCAGHDARSKGKLMRKMAGQEPMWTPTPRLVEYIKNHSAWWDQFGVLILELEAKGAVESANK